MRSHIVTKNPRLLVFNSAYNHLLAFTLPTYFFSDVQYLPGNDVLSLFAVLTSKSLTKLQIPCIQLLSSDICPLFFLTLH